MNLIKLTGSFDADEKGVLKPGHIYIETEKVGNGKNFLANKKNSKWLNAVIKKFRNGPGGK